MSYDPENMKATNLEKQPSPMQSALYLQHEALEGLARTIEKLKSVLAPISTGARTQGTADGDETGGPNPQRELSPIVDELITNGRTIERASFEIDILLQNLDI